MINKIIIILFTVIAAVTFISCGKSDNKTTESQDKDKKQTSEVKSNTTDQKATIQLPTIQCDQCKKNITKALKKVDGVNDFKIDVDGKVMTVAFDNSKTDLAKVENAITAAGYDANDKKADPVAYEKLDDCCKVPGKH